METVATAIVVNYNTLQLTLDCLSSLCAVLGGLSLELHRRQRISGRRYVPPSLRCGLSKMNPTAASAPPTTRRYGSLKGKYTLLLNTDTFPQPRAIERLVAYLDVHPDIAVVDPRLLNCDGSLQKSCYPVPIPFRATCDYHGLIAAWLDSRLVGDYRNWRTMPNVRSTSSRRVHADPPGGDRRGRVFDEDFFFYGEETDWCRRFDWTGWKVCFSPNTEVYHLDGASAAAQPIELKNARPERSKAVG